MARSVPLRVHIGTALGALMRSLAESDMARFTSFSGPADSKLRKACERPSLPHPFLQALPYARPTKAATASASAGRARVRLRCPSAVTATSSSMRMPVPAVPGGQAAKSGLK